MDPHILYLDLDDTLLNSEKRVSPENAAAVRGALRAKPLIFVSIIFNHLVYLLLFLLIIP